MLKYKTPSCGVSLFIFTFSEISLSELLLSFSIIIFLRSDREYLRLLSFQLAGNYVKNIRHVEISCEDIRVAMYADMVRHCLQLLKPVLYLCTAP